MEATWSSKHYGNSTIVSQESVKKVYFFKTPLGPQHFRTFAMVKNVTGMKGLGRIICV